MHLSTVDTPPSGGACVGHDTNLWFPRALKNSPVFRESYRQALQDTAMAKQICESCHVSAECLSYALHHETHGIWGGKTERERQSIRRRLNIVVKSLQG